MISATIVTGMGFVRPPGSPIIHSTDHQVTAACARAYDWSQHALGPLESWTIELRTILSVLFDTRQPMCLFWGERAFDFYNDGYLPILSAARSLVRRGKRLRSVIMLRFTLDRRGAIGSRHAGTFDTTSAARLTPRVAEFRSTDGMARAQRSGRILIVEDHPVLADTLAGTLELEGFDVEVARSLREARDALRRTVPACIVLDGMLGDGEAETLIRELAAQGLNLPVVLCSASPGADTVAKQFAIQNVGKPYDVDVLLAAIDAALTR